MIPKSTTSEPSLRDALYALSVAKAVPDATLLDDMVRRYPQFGDELTDYAIVIAVDALRSNAVVDVAEAVRNPMVPSPAVSRAMSRFQNRLYAVSEPLNLAVASSRTPSTDAVNPFALLTRYDFRDFAMRLDVNDVFVAKLRDRQIEPDTLTPGFRQRVADDLRAPLAAAARGDRLPQCRGLRPSRCVRQRVRRDVRRMNTRVAPTWFANIWIAGDHQAAVEACREFCMTTPLCVTVTPTTYVYVGGAESGVCVRLINYPRFAETSAELAKKAEKLADHLRERLHQHSYSLETSEETMWTSVRE